jgi:hypothetical protein
MSALPPKADIRRRHRDVRFGSRLLNHLIGCGEQRLRNGQAERLCGVEIDNQLILGRRLHRHVGRLLALENAVDVVDRTPFRPDR